MGTILFILLFFFVLLPLGRVAWAIWRQYRIVKRHMRDAQQFRDSFDRGHHESDSDDSSGHRQHSRRDKKIADDVGEYVAFEEMKVFNSEEPSAEEHRQTPAESQIEDADWEEIK